MEAQQNQDGSQETDQEYVHPDKLINDNPFSSTIYSGVEFVQSYGWFLLLGVIVCLYIKSKLSPKLHKMKERYEEEKESKKFDSSVAQSRLEAMEASRRRLQEQHDMQAAQHAEKLKEKEEERRQQKIEDWDGHQQGKGYRSKFKPKEETASASKPKPKPLRSQDYNPLAGDGGSCSWRPAQRRGGGG